MGLFLNADAVASIVPQLLAHSEIVTFSSLSTNIDAILDQAALADLHLLGCVVNWSINYTHGINKKIKMKVVYDDYLPADFGDVVIDNGTWRPADLLAKGGQLPPFVRVVTRDVDEAGLKKRIEEDIPKLKAAYLGPLSIGTQQRHKANGFTCVIIAFLTAIDQKQYESWQKMARRQVESISKSYLGGKTPPPFLRVFLALSYIQQNCNYDDEAAAVIQANPEAKLDNPHVLYPYGVICRGEGICEGISAAFKMFMDYCGVECLIVSGDVDGEGHKWNLVKLDEMYYHVDPSAGISGNGVYVGGFLKTDRDMAKANYVWDTDAYPSCLGRRYNYYSVEDYIEDNGAELLSANIDPAYLMPDNILM